MSSFPKITIRDVAQKAGVTMTTVSSALHRRGRVSEVQRERIQQIAADMGYQPKIAAQVLRARSTSQIGLILPIHMHANDGGDGHASPILYNFVRVCEARGLHYHVEFVDASQSFTPPIQVTGGIVDGLLVGGYVSEELTQWLSERDFPWVSVDEPAEYSVVSASDEGIYHAVERLAALGHRHIAYAGIEMRYNSQRVAYEGFMRAVEDFQIQTQEGDVMRFSMLPRAKLLEEAASWGRAMLEKANCPTAVLCHDSVLARGIIYAALQRGLRVPEDLSVISVGLATDAEKSLPCLTTLQVDFEGIVDRAMGILEGRLQGRNDAKTQYSVKPELVMRQTVAAPRKR